MPSMFENEILRLVELRIRARGNRALLARIDRLLHIFQEAQLAGGAQLDAVLAEIDALSEELDGLP